MMGQRAQEYWMHEFEKRGAFWKHDGNPLRPHVLLTSGDHSDRYYNIGLVAENPMFFAGAADDLVSRARQEGLDIFAVDRVVGPAFGAITLAYEVARQMSIRRTYECLSGYAVKIGEGSSLEGMMFQKSRIIPNERVLVVEDVMMTGGSVKRTINAVTDAGGVWMPPVLVLVNRSNAWIVRGKRIAPLIWNPTPSYSPAFCPFCKKGSEAIIPKGENWQRLVEDYPMKAQS